MARIFVSFKDNDGDAREGFEGTLSNPNRRFVHVPVSSREDVRPRGRGAVENYLRDLVKSVDVVVCLLGNHTADSPWVQYELDVAISIGVPIVPVRISGENGPLPARIAHLQEVRWKDAGAAIDAALRSRH